MHDIYWTEDNSNDEIEEVIDDSVWFGDNPHPIYSKGWYEWRDSASWFGRLDEEQERQKNRQE